MSERKMNVSDSGFKRLVYPPSVVGDQVDSYHGVRVADPYRWLENDVRDSGAVRVWDGIVRQPRHGDGWVMIDDGLHASTSVMEREKRETWLRSRS